MEGGPLRLKGRRYPAFQPQLSITLQPHLSNSNCDNGLVTASCCSPTAFPTVDHPVAPCRPGGSKIDGIEGSNRKVLVNHPEPMPQPLWVWGVIAQPKESDAFRTHFRVCVPSLSTAQSGLHHMHRNPLCPLCVILLGCFMGPWTVTRSSLRMLRHVNAFCWPLRPVLLLVSFPRSRSPVVGVPGLCWLRRVPCVGVAVPSSWRTEVVLCVAGVV